MEPGSESLADLEGQGMDRIIVHKEAEERREMFSSLREGGWNSMLDFLNQHGSGSSIVHPVSTEFKDTIVHAAAALGQTGVVKDLLVQIKEMNLEMSLGVLLANQLGNNPLHSAALMGRVDTLRVIFDEVPELASARNIYGETPIFQAAVTGSKQVFSELASRLPPDTSNIITMLRRNDGNTILHCAISGEYFDLASDIIKRFSQLIYYRNGRGLTPLHILANNPSGFKSGCQLGLLNRLLYSSIKFSTESTSDEPTEVMEENDPRELAGDYILNRIVGNFWWRTFEGLGRRSPLPLPQGRAQSNDTQTSEDPHPAKCSRGSHLGNILAISVRDAMLILLFVVLALVLLCFYSFYVFLIPAVGVIESPFLIAGKKGVIEMVEEIKKSFPVAIHDKDIEHKNIMLLAAEHRQHEIYPKFLNYTFQSWFGEVDAEGNSLLHLAAKYPDNQGLLISGAIPGAALQMQREIAWFNFVKKQLPPYFSTLQNHKDQTAMEVFTETHQELAMQRAKWLSKASQSCSVVATLIISVVFATMSTVPGGLIQEQQDRGLPVYRGRLAFNVFSVSSLSALCFSSISLIMFLNMILTSPFQHSDIGNNLATKLILGLGFLFISIMAMFLSFFSGDLFVLDSKMKYIAYPMYVLTSCVVLAGFPLYSEIAKMVVTGIPTSTHRRIRFSF